METEHVITLVGLLLIVWLFVDCVILQRKDEWAHRVPLTKRFARWARQAWDLLISM